MTEPTTTPPFDLHVDVSAYRPVERMQPGMWWHCTWTDTNTGETGQTWAQAQVVMQKERLHDSARVTHVVGIDTAGDQCDLLLYRGQPVRTLSARDAARVGVALPQSVVQL